MAERLQDSVPSEIATFYIVKDYQRMFNEVEESRRMMKQASKHIGNIQQRFAEWQIEREKLLKKVSNLEIELGKVRRKNKRLREKAKYISSSKLGSFFSRLTAWWIMIKEI